MSTGVVSRGKKGAVAEPNVNANSEGKTMNNNSLIPYFRSHKELLFTGGECLSNRKS